MVNVPKLTLANSIICSLLNVVLPGWGTILAGCLEVGAWNKTQMWIGTLQFFLGPWLVGWFWAMYWDYLFLMTTYENNPWLKEQANNAAQMA